MRYGTGSQSSLAKAPFLYSPLLHFKPMMRFFRPLAPFVGAAMLLPAAAFAQTTTGPVNGTFIPPSTPIVIGQNSQVIGTIVLNNTSAGTARITSIPFALSTAGGASAANLTDCSLYNYNVSSASLTNPPRVLANPAIGQNIFTLDQPLDISFNSPIRLTVRCNVNTSTPIGGSFGFAPASPTFSVVTGIPNTGTSGSLGTSLVVFPTVHAGSVNAPIAALTLNGTSLSTNTNIGSIPVNITYGNGLSNSYLSSCRWTNQGSLVGGSSVGTLNTGNNPINLNNSVAVTGGGTNVTTLILSCDVSSAAPINGTIMVSVNPESIVASNASNGSSVIPVTAINNGVLASTSGTTTVVANSGTVTPPVTGTPGVPNTGAGAGAPLNILLLLVAGVGLVGASVYLVRARKQSA